MWISMASGHSREALLYIASQMLVTRAYLVEDRLEADMIGLLAFPWQLWPADPNFAAAFSLSALPDQ